MNYNTYLKKKITSDFEQEKYIYTKWLPTSYACQPPYSDNAYSKNMLI